MDEADFLYELGHVDETASCLDCRHWCISEGCAMADDPAVDAFTTSPANYDDADMRHCPGFEDVEP